MGDCAQNERIFRMMDISAALVGGLFDEDGVPAYARPVLFGTAGDAVSAYLPDAVGARFFVQGEGEPQVAGTVCVAAQEDGRFAALKALPACGHVLVIAAPFALKILQFMQKMINKVKCMALKKAMKWQVIRLPMMEGSYFPG